MNETPVPRRKECPRCLRPQAACVCPFAATVQTDVEVLVLQHPMEEREAKGTARLLHLSLPGSRLVVGEQFDDALLRDLLHAGDRAPVLLYPAEPGAPVFGAGPQAPSPLRLVVLDGTWRKSRKMLFCNPILQTLPRLVLADVPPSSYRIRKAHAAHQLSTLEAAAYALAMLDSAADLTRLLDGFHKFVERQATLARR